MNSAGIKYLACHTFVLSADLQKTYPDCNAVRMETLLGITVSGGSTTSEGTSSTGSSSTSETRFTMGSPGVTSSGSSSSSGSFLFPSQIALGQSFQR